TCASAEARSETSMSVAARCRRPASARSWIPPRTSTAVRVETPRATVASFAASSSFATVILSPAPTIISESIIYRKPRCSRRGWGSGETGPDTANRAILPVGADGGELVVTHMASGSARLAHASCELLHQVVHRPVLTDQTRDLGGRMDDGRVIAAAELLAD